MARLYHHSTSMIMMMMATVSAGMMMMTRKTPDTSRMLGLEDARHKQNARSGMMNIKQTEARFFFFFFFFFFLKCPPIMIWQNASTAASFFYMFIGLIWDFPTRCGISSSSGSGCDNGGSRSRG